MWEKTTRENDEKSIRNFEFERLISYLKIILFKTKNEGNHSKNKRKQLKKHKEKQWKSEQKHSYSLCFLFFTVFAMFSYKPEFLNKKHVNFGQGLDFLNFGQGNRGLNQQNRWTTKEIIRKLTRENEEKSIRKFEFETLISYTKFSYLIFLVYFLNSFQPLENIKRTK